MQLGRPYPLFLSILWYKHTYFCNSETKDYNFSQSHVFQILEKRTPYAFFPIRVFFHGQWWFTGLQGWVKKPSLFLFTTSNHLQTFSHLFATLNVIWLPRTFNCVSCNYQTATQWFYHLWELAFDWLLIIQRSQDTKFTYGNLISTSHDTYLPAKI